MQLLWMCAGKNGAVFHTPCSNQCGNFLKIMEDEQRIRRQGLLLQKRYLVAARNLSSHHRQVVLYARACVRGVCVCARERKREIMREGACVFVFAWTHECICVCVYIYAPTSLQSMFLFCFLLLLKLPSLCLPPAPFLLLLIAQTCKSV